jgi:hypothetical protein
MKFQTTVVFFITILILTGCSGIQLQKYPAETCEKIPGDNTISIINNKCLLCHKGDFATKELICSRKNMIIDAVSTARMPKFRKLSDDELKTILKWEL